MWVLPSRSKPESLLRFFKAFGMTKADTPGLVVLDRDDPLLDDYRAVIIPPGWSLIVEPRHESVSALRNSVFNRWPDNGWFGMISDSVMPTTEDWDKELVKAAGTDGVAYGYNKAQGFKYGVIGGDLAREMGCLVPTNDKKSFADMAKERGVLRYCPDVIFESDAE